MSLRLQGDADGRALGHYAHSRSTAGAVSRAALSGTPRTSMLHDSGRAEAGLSKPDSSARLGSRDRPRPEISHVGRPQRKSFHTPLPIASRMQCHPVGSMSQETAVKQDRADTWLRSGASVKCSHESHIGLGRHRAFLARRHRRGSCCSCRPVCTIASTTERRPPR